MDELERILGNQTEQQLPSVLTWLRKMFIQYNDIQNQNLKDFILQLDNFVRKQLNVYHSQEKILIEIALRLFLRFLRGNSINTEPEKLNNTDPVLFELIFSQLMEIPNHSDVISTSREIFNETLTNIETEQNPISFYSAPSWFYSQKVLSFLSSNLPFAEFQKEISKIFQIIDKITKVNPNFSTLTFLADAFRYPQANIAENYQEYQNFYITLLNSYSSILSSDRFPPSTIISLFFSSWWGLFKQFVGQKPTQELPSQIEIITRQFDKISGQLYHDMQRMFQWGSMFLFYLQLQTTEQKNRTLVLICNAIRRVIDVEHPIRSNYKHDFIKYLFNEHKNNRSWEVYIIIRHIADTISSIIFQTTNFNAVCFNGPTSIFSNIIPNQIYNYTCTFAEQSSHLTDSHYFDSLLNTNYKIIFFNEKDKYIKAIEDIIVHWDTIKRKLPETVNFFKQFSTTLIEAFVFDEANNYRTETNRSYVRLITRIFIQLAIAFSHANLIVNHFILNNKLSVQDLSPNVSPLILNFKKTDEFKSFKELFDVIKKINPLYHNDIVRALSTELFNACKQEKLTLNLVKFFESICVQETHPLIVRLAQVMLEQIPDRITNLFAVDTKPINLISQWVIFTIRFAQATRQVYRNSPFILSLITYNRITLFGIVIHLKMLTVTKPIWEMVDVITHVLLKLYPDESNYDMKQRIFIKPRAFRITDSERCSFLLSIREQFKYANETKSALNLNIFAPMLETAFNTEDDGCIDAAGTYLAQVIDSCIDEFNEKNNEHIMRIPKLWFKTMNKANPNTMQSILEHTPQFFKIYLKPEKPTFKENNPIKYGGFGFDLNAILKSILDLSVVSKDEIFHLLNLLNVAFNSFLEQRPERNLVSKETLINMFILLNSCFSNDSHKQKAKKLSDMLVIKFGDRLLEKGDNLFLISLFETIGQFKAEMFLNLTDMAQNLIKYLLEKGLTEHKVRQIIDHVLDLSDHKFRSNTVLTTFSYFIKHLPTVFTMADCRMLLNISSENMDDYFKTLFKTFIDTFVDNQNDQGKDEFLNMVYTSALSMSFYIRHIINKLFVRINRRIRAFSLYELESCPIQNFYHKFTLAVFSGTITEANDMIIRRSAQLFQMNDESGSIEKAVKTVTFSWAVTLCPSIFESFRGSQQLLQMICLSIVHTFYTRNSLLAELVTLALQAIKQNDHIEQIMTPYLNKAIARPIETSPAALFSSTNPKFSRRVKNIPEKTPPEFAETLGLGIIEFANKNDEDRIKATNVFYHMMKTLCLKTFLANENTKRSLMKKVSDDQPLLKAILKSLVNIYANQNIAYIQLVKKYVIRLMVTYPAESVDALLFSEDIPCAFDFCYDMISNDSSLTIFTSLYQRINCGPDCLGIKSFIYRLIHVLTDDPKFCSINLSEGLENAFKFTYQQCSDNKKTFDNYYDSLTEISYALINCYACKLYPQNKNNFFILNFTKVFSLNYFQKSELYHYFRQKLLTKDNDEIAIGLTSAIYNVWQKCDPTLVNCILPNCIKCIERNDPDFIDKLWSGVMKIIEDKRYLGPTFHAIKEILRISAPKQPILQRILKISSESISDGDVTTIVYALKLLKKLQIMKLLPPFLFHKIFNLLFYYSKFFEFPYQKHSLGLLEACKEYLEDLPIKSIKSLHLYCNNYTQSLSDFIRLGQILSNTPVLQKYLPFSFISVISNEISRNCMSEKSNVIRMFTKLNKLNKDLIFEGENFNELVKIALIFMDHIKALKKYELMINFVTFIMEHGSKDSIDSSIVRAVKLPVNSCSLMYLAISLKYWPEIFERDVPQKAEIIDSAIRFTDPNISAYKPIYSMLIDHIFINKEFFLSMKNVILNYFKELVLNFNTRNTSRLLLFTDHLVRFHLSDISSNTLDFLLSNYPKVNPNYLPGYFEYLVKTVLSTDYLNNDQQILLKFVFDHIEDQPENETTFMKMASELIKSDEVCPTSKEMIIDFVIEKAFNVSSYLYEDFIEVCQKYEIDISVKIFNLYVIAASSDDNPMRINAIDHIKSYLPLEDISKAAFLLKNYLNISLWRDRFLPVIAAVLTPKDGCYYPLFSLSHLLTRVGDELIETVLINVINEENQDEFADLLRILTSIKNKKYYVKILSALIHTFYIKHIKVPLNTAERALKYSFDPLMSSAFFDADEVPSIQKFKPNVNNDAIFSFYSPRWSNQERTAAALTMLQQYQTADIVFQDMPRPECKVLFALKSMQNRFNINKTNKLVNNVFLMMRKTENAVDETIEALRDMGEKCRDKLVQPTQEAEQRVLSNLIYSLTKRKYKSIFEKERVIMIMCAMDIFRKSLRNEKYQLLDMSQLISPSLFTGYEIMISNVHAIPKRRMADQIPNSPCYLLLQPSFAYELPTILGFTEGGLVAAGSEQISNFFQTMGRNIQENKMTNNEWYSMMIFSFNVFMAFQSPETFSTVFNACAKVAVTQPSYARKHTAVAMMLTLINHAATTGTPEYIKSVQDNSGIFAKDNTYIWRTWLQHFITLGKHRWLFDLAHDIFMEMPQRALISAQQLEARDVADLLQRKWANDNAPSQLRELEVFENYCSLIFQNNPREIARFNVLCKFVEQVLYVDDPTTIDINELLTVGRYINPLQQAASKLNIVDVEKISDFCQFHSQCKQNQNDIEGFVQRYFELDINFDVIEQINRTFMEVSNGNMLTLKKHNDIYSHISLYYLHKNFDYINDNILLMKFMSSEGNNTTIIISPTRSSLEAVFMESFTNFTYTAHDIMSATYLSRIRNINYPIYEYFQIGKDYAMIMVAAEYKSLSQIFVQHERMYIDEFIKSERDVNELPDTALLQYMSSKWDIQSFVKFRTYFMRSHAISAVIGNLLAVDYPTAETCCILFNATSARIVDPSGIGKCPGCPNFRMSKNYARFYGPNFEGEFSLAMAAAAHSFVMEISAMRAILHQILTDSDNSLSGDFYKLHSMAEQFENRVIAFSPPHPCNTSKDSCIRWYQNILDVIEATKATDLPKHYFPWF
ncbi:hypothetical protein TVAG_170240 [Trichomonas vaginalis G3]|uniref:Uncharacterized protein n=1 Tax=Trichomonas vaginalis (strain ATCC PRA-98 / G3) TaxID=412133 RepID=A2DPG6_TRIV3|nr:hypothetical protein TVAGG3_0680660 [Trichomonas vaginalis G3]EAY17710.1 hypothetical protein TVAG_170240 [Trichomonas vaginalis G3]KAI5507885.1 hypothetical protein TVAGG3_0680660 [Trichomonas vaginalis G3]|eukprot:XP_001329845.1 hypothetical protein [Trichomonas vaginalis G3]